MRYLTDTSNIFARYDLYIEVARQEARKVSRDAQLQQVADYVVEGDDEGVTGAVKELGNALSDLLSPKP